MKRRTAVASLVVVGSSNTDLVVACPRLPGPGETLSGGTFRRFGGGKGANQAVAAARAGLRVTFVGARGADDFGLAAAGALRKEGVGLAWFRVVPGADSGVALILVGAANGENLIAVAKSANDRLRVRDVRAAAGAVRGAGAVLASLEVPMAAVSEAARLAAVCGVPFVLNPAPARSLPAALLRRVHTLTPNESEAALLSGEDEPARAASILCERGCRNVVVTLGERGVVACGEAGAFTIPARKVGAVDTVGAGDCFSGWLAAGIAEGLLFREAVSRAMAAASLAVQRPGAQSGMPHRREVEAVLRQIRP